MDMDLQHLSTLVSFFKEIFENYTIEFQKIQNLF
jgi:hypothetical protein